MENENLSGWEDVFESDNDCLQRFKVEGGYLYHNTMNDEYDRKCFQIAMCFVPDVDLQRYQSHLRDAYNQGLKEADTLACCRHGVAIRLNTCVPCSIERFKESATPSPR